MEVLNHLATDDDAALSGHPGSVARVQPMPEVLVQDAEAWALRINARWRQSIENFFETGQLLVDAKASLVYGQFEAMVKTKLLFDPSTARRLMIISQDQRLRAHVHALPPSWGTLYDLTKLSDDEFQRGVAEKIIKADMERADVELLRPARIARPMSDEEVLESSSGVEQDAVNVRGAGSIPASPAIVAPQWTPEEIAEFENDRSPVVAIPDSRLPSGGLAIAHPRVEPPDSLDFFPTPPWATRALFEHVLKHLDRLGHCSWQTAWEPACGDGLMAEVLKEYFLDVLASDIKAYGYEHIHEKWEQIDFLNYDDRGTKIADWIITNPPFNDSTEFVLKALARAGTGVAMFVRLTWLESVGRYEKIFRDNPPTLIAIFSERVPLHKGRWQEDGVTMTAYIWLVWIKGAEPRAPFWIPPGCRKSLTKPDDAKRFGVTIEHDEAAA